MTEVTRREAAQLLGYAERSLSTLMSRDPRRWPSPVGTRGTGGATAYLYDLEELMAAAGVPEAARPAGRRPFHSSATISSDLDGLIECLECGLRYRYLVPHLRHKHALTAGEYRREHRLPATASLAADVTRAKMAARAARADTSHLEAYHSSEHTRAAARTGARASNASRDYEVVRAHRLPGQRHAVRQMAAARAATMDGRARQAGYADLDDAIAQTATISAAQAAQMIGVSSRTVRRRRAASSED